MQLMYEEIDFENIDITKPAPTREPERQYYYMEKAKAYVSEEQKHLGRPLTACTKTFGCPFV